MSAASHLGYQSILNLPLKSRFIYITGCDGTGKSTQAQLLVDQLRARGVRTSHVWLRFPFFFSAPLLAYARLHGYSWSETTNGVRHGYWDFRRSWAMKRAFPWLLLLDAALAGLWHVYLPLWLGYTLVCERFALDMLVDLSVACNDESLYRRVPGSLFNRLLPRCARIIILDLDAETIRVRRADLHSDRRLEERLKSFRWISNELKYPTISSKLAVEQVNKIINDHL